jgi:hypothetical protein
MPGQIDPRDHLANLLSPVQPAPLYRKGKVDSVSSSGATVFLYVTVDGTVSRPRKMTWNGNGSQPAVADYVYYIDHSPLPLVVGRVPVDGQDHNMGSGDTSSGSFTDSSGNLRSGISANSSAISSLQSTVSGHTSTLSSHGSSITSLNSSVSSLNTTVSGHTTSITSLNSSVSALNTTVTGHTNTLASHTSSINTLQNNVIALSNSLANALSAITTLQGRLAYYESNMTYLANLGAAYLAHTTHPPPGF